MPKNNVISINKLYTPKLDSKNKTKITKIVNSVNKKWSEETLKIYFVNPICEIFGWKTNAGSDGLDGTSLVAEKYQPNRGRLDILLYDNKVPRIVIECKKPSVTLFKDNAITPKGKEAIEQVQRYGHGVRFWRRNCLPNILNIITNGKEIIWFDGTIQNFNHAYRDAKAHIITPEIFFELYKFISAKACRHNDLYPLCKTSTKRDHRTAIKSSSVHKFSQKVIKWLDVLKKSNIKKEDALAMTLQILFLTVARDHGILACDEIHSNLGKSDWDNLFNFCKKRFNSNIFETKRPKKLSKKVLDKLYEDSKSLEYSLEAVPVEYVGDIYETLLHNLHKDNPSLSKTSYFTPDWLVKDIINEIKPKKDEKIFDPTCGSAAFLTSAFDYISERLSFENARKYLSDNVYGVDRDPLAIQVSRFALLVSLARKLDDDWYNKDHLLPDLTNNIVCHDFLNYNAPVKFDVAFGNPPWGSIDVEVKDKSIKNSLHDYKSYLDKTDVSIYVVERAFDMLSTKGRIGFLVQRSTIDGSKHVNFQNWWQGRIHTVWDFERDELFAPRNNALTAVLLGNIGSRRNTKIVNKSENKIIKINFKNESVTFEDMFYVLKGAEPAKLKIYEMYAKKYPNDKNVKYIATTEAIRHGNIEKNNKALFLHPDTTDNTLPKRFINWAKKTLLTGKEKGTKKIVKKSCAWWLKERAEIKRNDKRKKKKYSWLWMNGKEYYKFDGTQTRIVFPYILNGERLTAGIDKKGETLSLTSSTVLIPRENTTKEDVLYVTTWLNSRAFVLTEAQKTKLTASGGRATNCGYIKDLLIPEISEKAKKELTKIAKKRCIATDKGFTSEDLYKIDEIFYKELGIKKKKRA